MIWVIGIGIALLILLILVLITKVNISIHYSHRQDDDLLTIKARVWGIPVYRIEVPEISFDEDSSSLVYKQKKQAAKMKQQKSKKKVTKDDLLSKMKDFHRLLERVVGLHRIVRRFLSHIMIKELQWHTRIGMEDAAATGIAAGGAWMVKGNVVGLLDHYMQLVEPPQYSVEPNYEGSNSQTNLSCMISFRLGHAMGAAFQIVKFWKGRPHRG